MTKSDIQKIEKILQKNLPAFYKRTMLNYPFPKDSFADELLLPTDPDSVIEENSIFAKGENKFAVGSDGGEETYYIKLENDSKVYVYDFEDRLGQEIIKSNTWDDYLEDIQKTLNRHAEDEMEDETRRKNKKWWQFWI